MGTILASALIARAHVVLEDTGVRWPTAELLDALNDTQREIVLLRPSANTKTTNHQLVAGTKQQLPADGFLLIDIIRNTGSDGTDPGTPVRQTTRQMLDTQQPTWHTDPATAEIEHYVYDVQAPKLFWVYPQPETPCFVELQYAAIPPVLTASDPITLDDVYADVILDGILFRAYKKETEHDGNEGRAAMVRALFESRLGLKATADAATVAANSPEKR